MTNQTNTEDGTRDTFTNLLDRYDHDHFNNEDQLDIDENFDQNIDSSFDQLAMQSKSGKQEANSLQTQNAQQNPNGFNVENSALQSHFKKANRVPYKVIPLGVDNNLRCLVHGKHKDKRNVYLTKCSEKQCFIGHIINYSKTKALIVQQTILNLQTKGCFVPVVFKHSSQSMKHMKSGQFHDCVTVLNFESTHGMLRIALIGEKVHQVEEQDYRLVCGTERLEVSYKEIMYIQQNEGTDVHECHCFDLTAEPGTSVIHPAKLVENLARVAYASDGIFLQQQKTQFASLKRNDISYRYYGFCWLVSPDSKCFSTTVVDRIVSSLKTLGNFLSKSELVLVKEKETQTCSNSREHCLDLCGHFRIWRSRDIQALFLCGISDEGQAEVEAMIQQVNHSEDCKLQSKEGELNLATGHRIGRFNLSAFVDLRQTQRHVIRQVKQHPHASSDSVLLYQEYGPQMLYHSAEFDFPFGSLLAKNLLNQVPDFKFECIRANLSQVIRIGDKEYPLSLYLDKLKTRFSWGRRFQNENTQSEIGGIQLSELLYQIEDLIDPRAGTRYTIRVHTDHRTVPHNLVVIECRDERQQASLKRHLTRDHFFDDAIDLVMLRARKLVDVQVTKHVAPKKQQIKTVNFADSNYASTQPAPLSARRSEVIKKTQNSFNR